MTHFDLNFLLSVLNTGAFLRQNLDFSHSWLGLYLMCRRDVLFLLNNLINELSNTRLIIGSG